MSKQITAPEALSLYRSEKENRRALYLSTYGEIMGRMHIFRGPLAENLLTSANEWMRLVFFLLENADAAGATPQDIAHLQDDAHGLLYLRATLKEILS